MDAKWLVVASTALILARMTSLIVGDRFAAAGLVAWPSSSARAPPASTAADDALFTPFLDRNIFGAATARAAPAEDCARSSLRLVATIVSERTEDCAITVASDTLDVVRGGEANDLVVLTVEPGRAMIARSGRCEILELSPDLAQPEPVAASSSAVQRVGPNEMELDRAALDNALADVATIARDGRFVPRLGPDRQFRGFELVSLQPGGVFDQLGLKRGDLVRRINGYDVFDTRRSMEMYATLRDSGSITVDVDRRGTPLTLTYRLR